jgi:hypothetical protein
VTGGGRGLALALAVASLAASSSACIDGDFPARPSVESLASGGLDAGADGAPFDAGVTDAGLVVLASSSPCTGMEMVLSGGTLYWTEDATGTVKSVPASGGRVATLAQNEMDPGAIAVNDTFVFWVSGKKVVKRRALAGGSATVIVPAGTANEIYGTENQVTALLATNTSLFFGRFTFVFKVPIDGATPEVIESSPMLDMGIAGAFAMDATHLYQVEIFHNAVTREKIDGTQVGVLENGAMEPLAPDRIAISQGELLTDAIAVDDDDVLWANGVNIESSAVDGLESAGVTVVATDLAAHPITGFVISGDSVYFGADAVEVAPLAGGGPTTMVAPNQMSPGQFAADDHNVYWRTSDCKIVRLSR